MQYSNNSTPLAAIGNTRMHVIKSVQERKEGGDWGYFLMEIFSSGFSVSLNISRHPDWQRSRAHTWAVLCHIAVVFLLHVPPL